MVGRVEAHCREGDRLHVPEPLLIAVAVLFLGLGMLLGENSLPLPRA